MIRRRIAMQQTAELIEIEMRRQKILAAEIDDGAMLRLAIVIAIGLDQANTRASPPRRRRL